MQRKWLTQFDARNMKKRYNYHFSDARTDLLSTPEYTLWDVLLIGIDPYFSMRHLWNDAYYRYNLFELVGKIGIPVYFLHGRSDYFSPGEVMQAFYQHLSAPMGKTLIWFEKSGHEPEFHEPQKFRDIMIDAVLHTSSL